MIFKKNLRNNDNFKNIQRLILDKLKIKNFKDLKNILKKKSIKDLRSDNNLMIKIEQNLLQILKMSNVRNIKSLQYPVNIRVINNSNKSDFSEYDTRLIHCDAWSGAPTDSANGFIYLFAEKNCPKIQIYNPLHKKDKLRNYVGNYIKVNIEKHKLKKINFLEEIGNFIMWETYTPHQTILSKNIKNKENLRISLDFRIRYNNPYFKNSNINKNQKYINSKYYDPLIYWNVKKNFKVFYDLNSKTKYELMEAKKISTDSYNHRLKYLKKYY